MGFAKNVSAKFGKMRKAQDFLPIYTSEGHIMIQSDKSIGLFRTTDGKGKLCTKGCYTPHLAIAEPYEFPIEFVNKCIEALNAAKNEPGKPINLFG